MDFIAQPVADGRNATKSVRISASTARSGCWLRTGRTVQAGRSTGISYKCSNC